MLFILGLMAFSIVSFMVTCYVVYLIIKILRKYANK